jgi:hypothetical protein
MGLAGVGNSTHLGPVWAEWLGEGAVIAASEVWIEDTLVHSSGGRGTPCSMQFHTKP